MTVKNLCLVETLARVFIKKRRLCYSIKFLQIIPPELLQTMITNQNSSEIRRRIEELRRLRENELAQMLGLAVNWEQRPKERQKMDRILTNSDSDYEPTDKEKQKKREIDFLSELSLSIFYL